MGAFHDLSAAPAGAAPHDALQRIAEGAASLAAASDEREALAAAAGTATAAIGADAALVRMLDRSGRSLSARLVASPSGALAAELQGTRVPLDEATVSAGSGVLRAPVAIGGHTGAALELRRSGDAFTAGDELLARVVAAQLGLALDRLAARADGARDGAGREQTLALVDDAFSTAGSTRPGDRAAATVADAARASAVVMWRANGGAGLVELGHAGAHLDEHEFGELRRIAAGAAGERTPRVGTAVGEGRLRTLVTVPVPRSQATVLQALFERDDPPSDAVVEALAGVAARATRVVEAGEEAAHLALELEGTGTLLRIVSQAIAQLSLGETLETAIDRVSELLGVKRVAIYLREENELRAAAGREVSGPHARVAERLLALALGPFRARGMVIAEDTVHDPRLEEVTAEVVEAGIESAVGIPLVARGDVVGLLGIYPPRARLLADSELTLVRALAAQLAVAVENARLLEQAQRLGGELEQVLEAERQASRELRTLYEISRSFAQSLSLDTTLAAIVRAIVESFELDAAVIRMPDERREALVMQALYASDSALEESLRTIFGRPRPLTTPAVRRALGAPEPMPLDVDYARHPETSGDLLAPFLRKGSTGGVIQIATPSETVGTLTLLSLDPTRPVTPAMIENARSIAGQAALAIDNARLYQQQKRFADTMQRSLLPRSVPALPGLQLGDVYESPARVDVGGDVYDYVVLPNGRLAVVVGDVTGHGIEATADMAMAKFVFRSLAREHPDPGELLASANEVLVGEIPVGRFVTMVCVTVDPATGELRCANAGHPQPRLLSADGSVSAIEASGIALGVENGEHYPAVQHVLEPGAAIVLYTDGLIEARRNGVQYGLKRLDRLIAARSDLLANELARALVADCREFAGGELADDAAVVVIRRVAARARD
jgi:serine phosphatase RsbU (regulator of sigma subunit)